MRELEEVELALYTAGVTHSQPQQLFTAPDEGKHSHSKSPDQFGRTNLLDPKDQSTKIPNPIDARTKKVAWLSNVSAGAYMCDLRPVHRDLTFVVFRGKQRTHRVQRASRLLFMIQESRLWYKVTGEGSRQANENC